jgi:hypothetical protein
VRPTVLGFEVVTIGSFPTADPDVVSRSMAYNESAVSELSAWRGPCPARDVTGRKLGRRGPARGPGAGNPHSYAPSRPTAGFGASQWTGQLRHRRGLRSDCFVRTGVGQRAPPESPRGRTVFEASMCELVGRWW